jgi:hypothetical protein
VEASGLAFTGILVCKLAQIGVSWSVRSLLARPAYQFKFSLIGAKQNRDRKCSTNPDNEDP